MMSEWVDIELGDFIELKRGYDLPKRKRETGLIPLVSSSGESDFHNESKVKGPGVITGRYGTIGQVFYVEKDFWPLNTTLYVKDFKGNDPLFVYYFLKTISYSDYSDKAAVPGINRNHLHKAEVRVPVNPIYQQKLAEKLWTLDNKIELNRQTNQTLEQIAQAIFKNWFVDFEPTRAKIIAQDMGADSATQELAAQAIICGAITLEQLADIEQNLAATLQQAIDEKLNHKTPTPINAEQLATTAALFPNALVESELGGIPKGWRVSRIEDLLQRLPVGKRYSQKTASESGSIPILDQGRTGIIGYHDERPGLLASPDEPVIVFANHTCYMRMIMHNFSAIQNVLPFKGRTVNIYWLYFATLGKQSFVEYKGHWPDFIIKEVVVPDDELTVHFGEFVSSLLTKQYRNEVENQTLSSTRDLLLPRLLSGELDVSALANNSAPASKAKEALDV